MNEIGKNIAHYRKEKGLSQEKVAEYIGISRQAVTKWETGASRPSTENLVKLSELLGIDVECLLDTTSTNVSQTISNVPAMKGPWIFISLSFLCILAYLIYGGLTDSLYIGVVICIFILFIPIQLFMNLYFSYAIKNENYDAIAGFDSKTDYNMGEVRKLLLNINYHIGIMSTVYIFLLCTGSYVETGNFKIHGLLIFLYIIEFLGTIILLNHRYLDKIYNNARDIEKAKISFPITIQYIVTLLIGMGIFVIIFYVKNIENNSPSALALSGILLLAIGFSTVGFLRENYRIKQWEGGQKYTMSRFHKLCLLLTFLCFVVMLLFVL